MKFKDLSLVYGKQSWNKQKTCTLNHLACKKLKPEITSALAGYKSPSFQNK